MAFVLMTIVIVLVHVYLYRRLVRDMFAGGRARRVGAAGLTFLAVVVLATGFVRLAFSPEVSRPLVYVGYLWLAVALYLGILLVVSELGHLVLRCVRSRHDVERRRFLSRVITCTAAVAAVGTVCYGAGMARRPRIERREVVLDRLDPAFDGFTIAAVADIHLGPLVDRADLSSIVAMINQVAPDLVAVVGDLVDGGVRGLGSFAVPLTDLVAPTYFVTGNHEYYSDAAAWVTFLPTLGVRVLRNERVEIRRGDAVLYLAGCDDRTAAASGVRGHGFDLDAALAGCDPTRPIVLLCHQPVMIDRAARAGVDLQISGHTHGGQLWPFGYLMLIDQPVLAGLTRFGSTWLYVTRGIGFWGPPVRVGSPPEVTLLTLRARAK